MNQYFGEPVANCQFVCVCGGGGGWGGSAKLNNYNFTHLKLYL